MDVEKDPAGRDRLIALARERGVTALGVPAFLVGDRLIERQGIRRLREGILAQHPRIREARPLRPDAPGAHGGETGGALVAVAILSALANLVTLLCTAGLPAVYTQILSAQGLSRPNGCGD